VDKGRETIRMIGNLGNKEFLLEKEANNRTGETGS
jgi:hypothetical protein